MIDIVPELLDKIEKDFFMRCKLDPTIRAIEKKAANKKIVQNDVTVYARLLGSNLADTLEKHLAAENLPNGTLYFNIAKRIMYPMFEVLHKKINDIAEIANVEEYKRSGIGLKPQRARMNEKRINDFISYLVDNMTKEAEEANEQGVNK